MGSPWHRVSPRRALLRAAALVGAGSVVGGLVGCGRAAAPAAVAAATPTPVRTRTVLTWAPFSASWGTPYRAGVEIVQLVMEPFVRAHPGIDLRYLPAADDSTMPTQLLAGTAPDVFPNGNATASLSRYFATDAILDLSAYVKRDNVDVASLYPKAFTAFVTDNRGRLLALPAYVGAGGMIVNQGVLDQLGLTYPDPAWTYAEWNTLWRSAADPARKRLGTTVTWWGFAGASIPWSYYYQAWGGTLTGTSGHATCVLASAPDVASGEAWAGLILDKIASPMLWPNAGAFAQGGIVTSASWVPAFWFRISAEALGGTKFDFYPMPAWPGGPAAPGDANYWMINAASKHPDLAWELLSFVSTQPRYSRDFLMRATLLTPALTSLVGDFVDLVRAVVPPLARKNLQSLVEPLLRDYAYPNEAWAYANVQAYGMYGKQVQQILSAKESVPAAFAAATGQIDALEKEAPVLAGAAQAAAAAFPVHGAPVAHVAAGL